MDAGTKQLADIIKEGGFVIKSTDDRDLIVFDKDCTLLDGDCPWLSDEGDGKKTLSDKSILRKRIEPWLTALFQSEHLNLLCGSGLTTSICAKAGVMAANMAKCEFSIKNEKIQEASKLKSEKAGRQEGNFEDVIRTATELLRGLEIVGSDKADILRNELKAIMENFAKSILETERNIATSEQKKREESFNTLINFLLSFSSRTGNRERLNIFTTNYDRLVELGAELAGIHIMDRFVGTLMPIFRSSRLNLDIHYNPPGIRGEPRYLEGVMRFTKLHGSIDWVNSGDDIRRIGLPFGADDVKPYLNAPGLSHIDTMSLMIYPNPDKDRETAEYPYVELFRDFAASVCRPNTTLVTYGYSFGDEHINRVIKDMLTIPSTHLVIISYDDPLGRIVDFYATVSRKAQMTMILGHDLADISILTEQYLPKSAIDRNTFKLSELLQKRIGLKTLNDKNEQPQLVIQDE